MEMEFYFWINVKEEFFNMIYLSKIVKERKGVQRKFKN